MKKQEAILVSAFTGFLLTKDFADVHKFCEDLLGRPLILEMIENEMDDAHPTEKGGEG